MTFTGIISFVYILFLLGVIYFDARYFIIPNWLTFPAIGLFLICCIFQKVGIVDILLRILLSGGIFLVAGCATSFFLKKETLGGGDIKLITAVGLYLGWQVGIFIIFVSALSALVCVMVLAALKKRKLDDRIPFGFFIGLCGLIYQCVTF